MSYEVKAKSGMSFHPMKITKDSAIARGRYLNKLEYRESSDGAEWFTVEVIDKDGGVARKSYFKPVLGKGFVDSEEKLKEAQRKFNNVISNLTRTLLTDDYETGSFESFEEYCKKIIADIPSSLFKKELRVKCVYNKAGKPTLPGYPLIFEDPTKVSEDDSRLKLNDNDVVEKVEEPAEKMDEDILPSKINPMEDASDLPFD